MAIWMTGMKRMIFGVRPRSSVESVEYVEGGWRKRVGKLEDELEGWYTFWFGPIECMLDMNILFHRWLRDNEIIFRFKCIDFQVCPIDEQSKQHETIPYPYGCFYL